MKDIILKKINRAAFKYSDYIAACDKIAREAQNTLIGAIEFRVNTIRLMVYV